jgi:glycosyltransferase involved in cell wall biosynthesis
VTWPRVVRFHAVRILLDYRPALRARTGVGEFVHELAAALSATGTDDERVTVFTSSWRDRLSPEARVGLSGVSVVDRRIPVRLLAWAWNRLGWPPVERLAGPADVVHSQSPLLIPAAQAAGVITIHDLHFLSHPERSEAEIRRDYPALVHEHAQRADHVVVSSRFAAADVQRRLGVAADRITVCSPGAPHWAATVARERAASPAHGGPILFVGTLEPRKNIGGLLAAYAALRARRAAAPPLVILGAARPSVADVLRKVDEPPLTGHVTLRGYVGEEEKRALYRQAAMLVLPSFDEGFGLPVLEAMACGVPVVVSNRGSLPEVCGDAATPLDPDDADAIAAEMDRLLDAAAAGQAMQRGLARAAGYSWAACAGQARAAYNAAAAARRRRRS